jgi:hypothetical protein
VKNTDMVIVNKLAVHRWPVGWRWLGLMGDLCGCVLLSANGVRDRKIAIPSGRASDARRLRRYFV